MWHINNPRLYLASIAKEQKNPKTFRFQSELPDLPVPPLQQTCQKYLRTVQAAVSKEELEKSVKVVNDFCKPGGVGDRLQRQLEDMQKKFSAEKDASKKKSWLEDWWLLMAYHAWQDPIPITSNWYSVYREHPVSTYDEVNQLTRAAGLVNAFAVYKRMIELEQVPVDLNRKQPMCMDQITRIYSTVRIPGVQSDHLVTYPFHQSKHIIVLRQDQIYYFDIFENQLDIISEIDIQSQLKFIYEETETIADQPPIGLFTAEKRDIWAKVRELLMKNPQNKANFDIIDRALFVVCLDDTSPKDRNEIAQGAFHNYNGRNRWFDKSFNVIIFKNGKAGLNAEHSPLDAPPLAHGASAFSAFYENVDGYIDTHKHLHSKRSEKLAKPKKIVWDIGNINDDANPFKISLQTSANNVINFMATYHTQCLEYDGYGSDFLKEVNVSPDAYVQMVIQLAYYKIYKKCTATYETAQTRKFFHGRTETVRTLSLESKQFVEAMENSSFKPNEKLQFFKKAIESHVHYMNDASNGNGIDRHLLGLMMCAKKNGEAMPEIFLDPSYTASKTFRLSTSNLTPAPQFYGGFGPVVDDGYGVCYALRNTQMWFSVSSRTNCHSTDTIQFIRALNSSLEDLRALCLQNQAKSSL